MNWSRAFSAATLIATGCAGSHGSVEHPPAPETRSAEGLLGKISFDVSGSPECRRRFEAGMLALHSFLYERAHTTFEAALSREPSCQMAAWGDAMTYERPIWRNRDTSRARAALAHITHEETMTAKERAHVATARALFAKDDDREAHDAWVSATESMRAAYPDDDEVLLQHALALLARYGYDPTHVREQMEAGAIALDVLHRNASHPGAAHYAIHAFDSREHAILALPAARLYAGIAPVAGHAQHMPSHTFTHLGMWREVVLSNERAFASSIDAARASGAGPSKYDWHAYSWSVAAMLELGRPARARHLVEQARAFLVAAKDDSASLRHDYANMVTSYITSTGRWNEVEDFVAPLFSPAFDETSTAAGTTACAAHAPGGGGQVRPPLVLLGRLNALLLRAEAALQRRDKRSALNHILAIKEERLKMAPWAKVLPPEHAPHWDAVVDALVARAAASDDGRAEAQGSAITALEKLVEVERHEPIAGPAWSRTPAEILGEVLIAVGRPKEALEQLDRALDLRPNRALTMLLAARAARAAGDPARARARYAELAAQWREPDAELATLAEVRGGAQ